MIEALRNFLDSKAGKISAGLLVAVCVIGFLFSMKSSLGESEAVASSTRRKFVDSETNQSFDVEVKIGMAIPMKSPFTGRATGYEADEVCSWTADGQVAETPTYVLMNATLGKTGPTFCPTCGRLVVEHNPSAEPGMKAPPTKAELAAHGK